MKLDEWFEEYKVLLYLLHLKNGDSLTGVNGTTTEDNQ